MNRRLFIKAAVSSIFLPSGILTAKARTRDTDTTTADYFFFDERFIKARQLAAKLSNSKPLIPVRGDITELWNGQLKRACVESPLVMRGVTTESFYFCLRIMAGSIAGMESQVTRINRDLLLWTIRSNNKLKMG